MKVLLISANTITEPYPVYPLGLDYVAGALTPRHRARILDLNAETHPAALSMAVDAFSPDIIGISLRNADTTDITHPKGFWVSHRELVERVRRLSSAPIVLGGSAFTIFPEKMMEALGADYGIVGEGERLADLLAAIDSGRDPKGMPGVLVKGDIGGNLTGIGMELPIPWEKPVIRRFDATSMHLPYYLSKGGMLNLQTKRGCPFGCVYCTYPQIEGRRMRLFPPETVARTALELQEAGARYLFITDSAFNAEPDHSLAVAKMFRKLKLSIPWGGFFAPTGQSLAYFKELAEAGLTHVEFGTESLDGEVLKAYGKPFGPETVVASHMAALAAGLHVAHYFLLGGPGETGETLDRTLSRMENLKKSVFFVFQGMRIYPRTALHQRAVAEGGIPPDRDLLDPVFYRSLDKSISSGRIAEKVTATAKGRLNWVTASGGADMQRILSRMYEKGYTGPLWEYLIRG